jgi:hypothetical protein
MAARKPRKKPVKRVRTVKDESYTELEMYCIWLTSPCASQVLNLI